MIWIYEQGHEDFSTNGLGSLLPARCEIKEEQNGAYELELDHPIDKDGLFSLLKTGRVIKAPVPAQTTPIIRMPATTSYEVWETSAKAKVYTKKSTALGTTVSVTVPGIDLKSKKYDVVAVRGLTENEPKTVTKWKSNGNRVLEKVEAGVEVSVLSKDGAWYKVTTPNGNTGWMQASALTLVQTVAARPPETIQERKIRDQLFRIYRAEKDTEAGEVKVWARHISYDLLGNVLLDCKVNDKTVTQAIAQIDAACTQADHGFTIYTDSTATITADWSRKGYLEALLDPDEGLLSLANLRLVRDNYDLFLLERSEVTRQSVSYGTNLMGVTLDINEDSIVNRIVPVGKTKDGEPLYIDDEYVDSPRNDAATIIRAKVIEYSDVAEKDDEPAVTLAQAKAALIARANTDFEQGIDLPDITVDIDFLQLGDTVEYAAYRDLDRLYLGDLITVRDDAHDVELDAEITQVDYDVLTNRYIHMSVGVTEAARTIGSTASFMLPNGSLGGRKIAMGSLDGGHLQGASISGSHIKDSAITNSHFMNGTISGSIFEDGTITGSKIDASTFENGSISGTAIDASTFTNGSISGTKIDTSEFVDGSISGTAIDASTFTNGQISGTKIADSSITNSKFANGTIEGSKIKESTITGSHINASTFTNGQISGSVIDSSTLTNIPYAEIKDLDADTALFRTGVGDDLYLDRLVLNSANIGTATIGELMVRDDQGKLHKVLIGTNGVVSSEEVKMDGQNLSNDAMMQVSQRLVWRQDEQPSAPFIGMIWMDTSATPVSGKAKEILKRCTAITPTVTWEVVQSNELHTNVIDVDDNGMNILTGGELNVLGGSVNIKSLDGAANVINMDNTGLTISSTGQLKLQSTDSIIIGGNPFGVGGTNLITNSDFTQGLWGTYQVTAAYSSAYRGKSSMLLTVASDKSYGFASGSTVPYDGVGGLTVSGSILAYVSSSFSPSNYTDESQVFELRYYDSSDVELGRHHMTAGEVRSHPNFVSGTFCRVSKSFGAPPAGTAKVRLYLYCYTANNTIRYAEVQVEKGTMATDWSPAPSDPASGVKTSKIEIGSDFIDIESGGTLTLDAADDIKIGSGSDTLVTFTDAAIEAKASTIDLSANDSIKLAVSSDSDNLIKRTIDFDTSVWEHYKPGGTVISINTSTAEGYFVIDARTSSRYGYVRQDITGLYVQGNTDYVFSMDYTYLDVGCYIELMPQDSGGNNLPGVHIKYGVHNGPYSAAYKTPPGTASVRITIFAAQGTYMTGLKPCLTRGTLNKGWSPHPKDPASGVKTSSVEVNSNGIYMDTTGEISMNAGTTFKVNSGTVQIEAGDASDSVLQFGDAFSVSKEGTDYTLAINSKNDDAIKVNGRSVWHKGNIIVQEAQPPGGKQTIWLKPNATSGVVYSKHITATLNHWHTPTTSMRSHNLAAQSSDTMSASGTYTFSVKITFKRFGGSGTSTYSTSGGSVQLKKGGATLSLSALPAMSLKPWASQTVTVTGSTTSAAFTSGTGDIVCEITVTGTKAYDVNDFLAYGRPSDIVCSIIGPGGSTAQACQVYYVP